MFLLYRNLSVRWAISVDFFFALFTIYDSFFFFFQMTSTVPENTSLGEAFQISSFKFLSHPVSPRIFYIYR